ncbi:MAG: PspA/IM30 family protein, partial [Pseudomonadota bacterium]
SNLVDLRDRLARLRLQVDAQHRKLIDLKQGAQMAKAVRSDRSAHRGLTPTSSASEAEALIEKVCGSKDPFEFDSILDDINQDLSGENLTDRMAAQGYGAATKSTADDIIARLKK